METQRIFNEELWGSVVWFAIGLFGWSLIISSTTLVEATALTALGLPLLTWGVLTVVMIGIRVATGLELKAQTESGQFLWLITGSVLGGFLVLYDVLVNAREPSTFIWYGAAIVFGVILWQFNHRRKSPEYQ